MLRHIGLPSEATRIEAAVSEAVRAGQTTQDVGGRLGTREAAEWIAARVAGSSSAPCKALRQTLHAASKGKLDCKA